jgi:hypothetical protein
MGYKYASMEIVINAHDEGGLLGSGGHRQGHRRDRYRTSSVPICYDNEYIINGQTTPLRQYRFSRRPVGSIRRRDKLNLVIIDNSLYPDVPTRAYRAR